MVRRIRTRDVEITKRTLHNAPHIMYQYVIICQWILYTPVMHQICDVISIRTIPPDTPVPNVYTGYIVILILMITQPPTARFKQQA